MKTIICYYNSATKNLELKFPMRPLQTTIDDLTANRWRFNNVKKVWFAKANSISRKVAEKYAEVPSEEVNQDAGLVDAQEQAAIANGNY